MGNEIRHDIIVNCRSLLEWSEFKNLVNLVVKEGCNHKFHI